MFPVQTMPLRSTPITGASSLLRAAVPRIYEPFPAHAAGVLTNLRRPDGRCAVRGSLVPCILAFHGSFSLSLWPGCHHWPATFDHSWFSAAHYNPKVLSCDSTPHGGGWLYNHPCVYELLGREFVGLFDILGVTAL